MIPTLISDNCICLSLDLSDSFNPTPQLQSQHAHKRLFTSVASLKNVRLVLHCFQGAVLVFVTFDPLPALPGSGSANVAWCVAKSHVVCAAWQHELFKKLVILNDLDVRTSCVINRCNIPCAPSRYADMLRGSSTDLCLTFLCECVRIKCAHKSYSTDMERRVQFIKLFFFFFFFYSISQHSNHFRNCVDYK